MNCSHFWKRLTAIVRDCRLLVQLKFRQVLDTSLLPSFGSRFCFALSSAASRLHSLWTFAYCGLYKASTSVSCSDLLFPVYLLLCYHPGTLPAVCFLLAIATTCACTVTVQTPNKTSHDKSLAFPSLDARYLETSVLKLPSMYWLRCSRRSPFWISLSRAAFVQWSENYHCSISDNQRIVANGIETFATHWNWCAIGLAEENDIALLMLNFSLHLKSKQNLKMNLQMTKLVWMELSQLPLAFRRGKECEMQDFIDQ